jgi:hypothetical protein
VYDRRQSSSRRPDRTLSPAPAWGITGRFSCAPGLPGLRVLASLVFLPLLSGTAGAADEPQLVSLFPLSAQRGTSIDVQVRGKALDSAFAVSFGSSSLTAKVRRIESIELGLRQVAVGDESRTSRRGQQAVISLEIPPSTRLGDHRVRLVTHHGVSNGLIFRVLSEPVVAETASPHQQPDASQAITIPLAVTGVIANPGEVDFYSCNVTQGQILAIELIAQREALAASFRPQVALYQPTGSWFDSHRLTRLAFNNAAVVDTSRGPAGQAVPTSAITHRFLAAGRYLIAVDSAFGTGAPEFSYQLRVTAATELVLRQDTGTGVYREAPAQLQLAHWNERTFRRRLSAEHMESLWSRTLRQARNSVETQEVAAAAKSPALETETPSNQKPVREHDPPARLDILPVGEQEPNNRLGDAQVISFPCIFEGIIEQPGDVDTFKFTVPAKGHLAFEIETPKAAPLRFNPRLDVLDAAGKLLFSNVPGLQLDDEGMPQYSKLNLALQPKVTEKFEKPGEHYLRVREITTRYGNSDFVYRVLIRQQIPHIGTLAVDVDRINLTAGESQQLTVSAELEEGFSGELLIAVNGLPAGVSAAFPTAGKASSDKPADEPADEPDERHAPVSQQVTVALVASEDAPASAMPAYIQITGRPVVQGKLGPRLTVADVPLMVIRPAAEERPQDAAPRGGG